LETKYVLLTLWIVVVLMMLINNFYYKNQKREIEYRKKKFAEKQQGKGFQPGPPRGRRDNCARRCAHSASAGTMSQANSAQFAAASTPIGAPPIWMPNPWPSQANAAAAAA